ncbi:MAG: DNA mismatch repair endonuclease MutL [Aaplasma endosymbiont of Hyalomma asiaticum]
MPIVILNAQTINKIAAGEVIECPASVVKELVENSIDAGAKTINVQVDKGGRNFISVSDDGHGIPKDEIEKAFTSHATSKLLDGDISNVKTMGFRGEGLTSIAAVSRVKMTSKCENSEKAWSITFEGGERTKDLAPAVLSKGTCVEVRDLFFATPTRLKFLRTEKAEMQNIVDLLNKLAIINYSIAFSFTVVERQVFKYTARENLNDRIREMKYFGEGFFEQSLDVMKVSEHLRVFGRIGLPTFNKSKPGMVYFFVNNRPVHSLLLLGAVRAAYSGMIPKDRHPVVVLGLDIMPHNVDVNVHPSKLEVRFQDKRLVYKTVLDALKNSIAQNVYAGFLQSSESTGIDHFAMDNVDKVCGKWQSEAGNELISSAWEHCTDQFSSDSDCHVPITLGERKIPPYSNVQHSLEKAEHKNGVAIPEKHTSKKSIEQATALIEECPLGTAVCQLFERYIISRAKDYVIIVDQHAAHERLVCEYIKKVTEQEGIQRQVLLMPELVELGNDYEFELLNDYREKLLTLGLVVEPIGDLTVVVREVPAIFGVVDVKSLIEKVVEGLISRGDELFMKSKLSHICGTMACYGSIRSGRTLRLEEMNSILRQMEVTSHSGQCNHGRPTYVKLSLSEIDKLFERT